MIYRMTEKRRQEESLECVFGLGGGELEKGTWEKRRWYEGAPDYAKRENEAAAKAQGLDPLDLRTALEWRMYPDTAGSYGPAPRGWVELNSYRTSGEVGCWWCGEGTGNESARKHCKLCQGDGYVYIGDGWCEVVYARKVKRRKIDARQQVVSTMATDR